MAFILLGMIILKKYNAYFQFNGETVYVYVTRLSYSWSMKNKGTSQAKQRKTLYPYRVEQSPLSISIVFSDNEEYRSFRSFIDSYHQYLTSSAGAVSGLVFASSSNMGKQTGKRFRYEVAFETFGFSVDYKTIAPVINANLTILDDGSGRASSVGSGSSFSGSIDNLVSGGKTDSAYAS